MRPAGFGRRIIEPGGRELVLIPGQEAPSPAPELANRDELKEQIRAALMARIDPSVVDRIPRPTLRAEVGKLVNEIATEQRIQLNELEEAALAVELTDDMVAVKLPVGRASLLAFVADAETEKALQECLAKLAFVHGPITRGGIAEAIEALATKQSPNVLIVDISGLDLTTSQVQSLAEVCEPAVTVVAIGDLNDVGLYRDLLQAGFTDYLVKPLTPQLLVKALTATTNTGVPPSAYTAGVKGGTSARLLEPFPAYDRAGDDVCTVTPIGWTTLPKAVRQALGVDGGGKIAYRIEDQQVTIYNPEEERPTPPSLPDYEDEITEETISRLNKIVSDDEFSEWTIVSGPAW